MPDEVFISHRFSVDLPNGTSFSDALVLPEVDYKKLKKDDLDALKTKRAKDHVDRIEAESKRPAPLKAQRLKDLRDARKAQNDALKQLDDEIAATEAE